MRVEENQEGIVEDGIANFIHVVQSAAV